MSEPASPKKISERAPAIVRVAYHQLSLMTGLKDPTEPPKPKEPEIVPDDKAPWLPIITSVTSTLCEQYKSLKESNESLSWFLDNATNHLKEGIQYITPLPSKAVEALETPLKGVEDAFRSGHNFFEDVVPSISNLAEYFRSALATTVNWLDSALVILRSQLAQITSSIEEKKDSTEGEKDTRGKRKE